MIGKIGQQARYMDKYQRKTDGQTKEGIIMIMMDKNSYNEGTSYPIRRFTVHNDQHIIRKIKQMNKVIYIYIYIYTKNFQTFRKQKEIYYQMESLVHYWEGGTFGLIDCY